MRWGQPRGPGGRCCEAVGRIWGYFYKFCMGVDRVLLLVVLVVLLVLLVLLLVLVLVVLALLVLLAPRPSSTQ